MNPNQQRSPIEHLTERFKIVLAVIGDDLIGQYLAELVFAEYRSTIAALVQQQLPSEQLEAKVIEAIGACVEKLEGIAERDPDVE